MAYQSYFFAIGLPDLTTTSSVLTEQTITTPRNGKGIDFHGPYYCFLKLFLL